MTCGAQLKSSGVQSSMPYRAAATCESTTACVLSVGATTQERHRGSAQEMRVETFLLVFAAIFPVVNPPGAALIFLGMTQGASSQTRRWLARRVAVNAFVIMNLSLTV